MKKLLFSFSLLLIASSSYALIQGQSAQLNEGQGIFNIAVMDEEDEENNIACTATKIGKNILITAAHCFDTKKISKILAISSALKNPESRYSAVNIKDVFKHPSYKIDSDDNESIDIALVIVEPNQEFMELKTRELDYSFVDEKEAVQYWGFGCQVSNDLIDDFIAEKKYASGVTQGEKILLNDFGLSNESVHSDIQGMYSAYILTLGLNLSAQSPSVCHGDSGGPVLRNEKIVGINVSYIDRELKEDKSSIKGLTDINLHQRVSIAKEWIQETILENSHQ
jgi:V8-like Glu-specific endopeptidase